MDIDLSKESICINKLICEKKEIFFVENDLIVPDSKPDVLKSVNLSGNICVYKKEVQDEKIKLDGSISTYIMYLPDSKEDKLRGLNTNLDFSEIINISGAKEGMSLELDTSIKDIECKVLNGRKISVKASVEVTIKLYSNEDIEIINSINNIEDIQTLRKEFALNSLIGTGNTKVYVKETLNINQNDEVAEILKTDINLINQDIKISYNKVLVKAEADVKIMYLTEDNKINKIQEKIPVVGFMDLQNISEENICDVGFEIANEIIKLNSQEEHSVYVELEVETICKAFEKKQINLLQDLYSPTMDLECNQRKISTMTKKINKTKQITLSNNINIEGITNENLMDIEVKSVVNKETISNNRISYEGELEVNVIYDNGSSINTKLEKVPFECFVENDIGNEDINVASKVIVNNVSMNVADSSLKIEVTLGIESILSQNSNMNVIENVNLIESRGIFNNDYDSLILYFVQNGETLWDIAKKFKSIIEDIISLNGIDEKNKVVAGQKLYIPKFKYVKNNKAIGVQKPEYV